MKYRRLRRLRCRIFGHRMVKATRHVPRMRRTRTLVGEGCLRCDHGTVREYRPSTYPRPREQLLDLR